MKQLLNMIMRGFLSTIPNRLLNMGRRQPRYFIKGGAINIEATEKHNALFYGVFRCDRCSALLNTGAPPPIGAARSLQSIDREWAFVFDHWEHRCTGILIEGAPFLVADIQRGTQGEALLPPEAAQYFEEPELTSRATRIIEADAMAGFQMNVAKGVLPRPGEVYRIVATRKQPNHGACMLGEKFPSVETAQQFLNLNREDWEHKYTLAIFPEPAAVEYCKRANILAEEGPVFWKPQPIPYPPLDRIMDPPLEGLGEAQSPDREAGAPDLERNG